MFLSCNSSVISNKEKSSTKNLSIEEKRINDNYNIINATLKNLLPEATDSEFELLINEKLLLADKGLIEELIANGGDDLLLKIDRTKCNSEEIKIYKINDFGNIKISSTYPLTTAEFKKHFGWVNYSKIAYNENKTKASFIFIYERYHHLESKVLCAVDVANTSGNWEITSKVCLNNHTGFLTDK